MAVLQKLFCFFQLLTTQRGSLKPSTVICWVSLQTIAMSSWLCGSKKPKHWRNNPYSVKDKWIVSTAATLSAMFKDAFSGILDGLREEFIAQSLKMLVPASTSIGCNFNEYRSIAALKLSKLRVSLLALLVGCPKRRETPGGRHYWCLPPGPDDTRPKFSWSFPMLGAT